MRRPWPEVMVVGRFPVVRAGIRALLEDDVAVLGEVEHLDPDDLGPPWSGVVVVDLQSLPPGEGWRWRRAALDGAPVVCLAGRTSGDLSTVVPLTASLGDLRGAVDRAARLLSTPSVPAVGRVEDEPVARRRDPKGQRLSGRETQILRLVAAGWTNPEIAAELFLSPNSVKSYLRTAYEKIGVTRRAQAVTWAIANRLVKAPLPDDGPARPGS